MITIFSSPRPFTNPHIATIQRNAITSWTKLNPRPEIFLIGDDAGVKEIAQELNLTHFPEVKKTAEGMPWRDDLFRIAATNATNPLLGFISADIILTDDFLPAIHSVDQFPYIMVGRRYDLDITEKLNFDDPELAKKLHQQVKTQGKLHGPSAVDYAVYPKEIYEKLLPPFPVNLPGWDGWFIYRCKQLRIPVIDATEATTVIHQNHELRRHKGTKHSVWRKDQYAIDALKKIGGLSAMLTMREADLMLTSYGLTSPPFPRILFSLLGRLKIYRLLLATKRRLQHYILK
jgi:hypothetical protein